MRLTSVFALLALLAVSPASAAPFGIEMGTAVDALDLTPTDNPFTFDLITVPSPHPRFDSYSLNATPEHGVCRIVAFSPVVDNDAYGSSITSEYEEVSDQITSKYGQPSGVFDVLKRGSIWDEPRDWVMSLFQKERTVKTFWVGQEATVPFPDNVETISLEVIGFGSSESGLVLVYEFSNISECNAVRKGAGAGAL